MRKFNALLLLLSSVIMFSLSAQNNSSNFIKGELTPDNPYIAPKDNPSNKNNLLINEGFEDISTLVGNGWVFQNNSNPIGSLDYFQGNSAVFPAYDGNLTDYIAVNFNSTGTSGPNTISNWLISPEIQIKDGDVLSFYTRTTIGSSWPDRLQVRLSTSGASTDVGGDENSVGDFTILLEDINPAYIVGGYPDVWTQIEIPISGIGNQSGRFALRYFVEDGGPVGTNSNYIGIDRVEYSSSSSVPLSNWAFALIGILAITLVFIKFRK